MSNSSPLKRRINDLYESVHALVEVIEDIPDKSMEKNLMDTIQKLIDLIEVKTILMKAIKAIAVLEQNKSARVLEQ